MRFGDIYVQNKNAFMNAKCIKRIAILSLSFLSCIGGSIIVLLHRHDTLFSNAEGGISRYLYTRAQSNFVDK